MIDRLAEDHANARRLGNGLARIPGITLAQKTVPTNIVMFDLAPSFSSSQFITKLTASGVKVLSRGSNSFRAVTHRMISDADIEEALNKIDQVCRE
jgi:threonine aldolase